MGDSGDEDGGIGNFSMMLEDGSFGLGVLSRRSLCDFRLHVIVFSAHVSI